MSYLTSFRGFTIPTYTITTADFTWSSGFPSGYYWVMPKKGIRVKLDLTGTQLEHEGTPQTQIVIRFPSDTNIGDQFEVLIENAGDNPYYSISWAIDGSMMPVMSPANINASTVVYNRYMMTKLTSPTTFTTTSVTSPLFLDTGSPFFETASIKTLNTYGSVTNASTVTFNEAPSLAKGMNFTSQYSSYLEFNSNHDGSSSSGSNASFYLTLNKNHTSYDGIYSYQDAILRATSQGWQFSDGVGSISYYYDIMSCSRTIFRSMKQMYDQYGEPFTELNLGFTYRHDQELPYDAYTMDQTATYIKVQMPSLTTGAVQSNIGKVVELLVSGYSNQLPLKLAKGSSSGGYQSIPFFMVRHPSDATKSSVLIDGDLDLVLPTYQSLTTYLYRLTLKKGKPTSTGYYWLVTFEDSSKVGFGTDKPTRRLSAYNGSTDMDNVRAEYLLETNELTVNSHLKVNSTISHAVQCVDPFNIPAEYVMGETDHTYVAIPEQVIGLPDPRGVVGREYTVVFGGTYSAVGGSGGLPNSVKVKIYDQLDESSLDTTYTQVELRSSWASVTFRAVQINNGIGGLNNKGIGWVIVYQYGVITDSSGISDAFSFDTQIYNPQYFGG